MKKRMLTIISLLLIAVMLVGCGQTDPGVEGSGDGSGEATYKETVKFVPDYKFQTTDTMNTTSSTSMSIYWLVYNNLVEMDTTTGELVPALAESWEAVSPTEYVFYLREGVKFHDGSDFTAADVVFTFDRAKVEGASSSKVITIDHVEAIDDYTVKFVLTGPDADLPYRLPDGRLSILSKTAFDNMPADEANLIGTGPYKYVEVVIDDHVTVTRNDEYWGEAPITKTIIFQEIPEQSARLIALQTGEVDIINNPAATDRHYIDESDNMVLKGGAGSNLRYIALNLNEAPFDDIRVRQAIGYGINRSEYIAVAYSGNAAEVNNMMNPINEFYTEVEGYEYNPEKAKALLQEAGYSDGDITISILGMQSDQDNAFATVFQSQMKAIGINVEVELVESAVHASYITNESTEPWQAAINGWSGYITGPDNAFRYLMYSTNMGNMSHVNNPEIDALLDEGAITSDKEARQDIYKQLQELILAEACYFPICVPTLDYAMYEGTEGVDEPYGIMHHLRYVAVPAK